MKNRVGLWIDHRQAVIVTLTLAGEEKQVIRSGVERQPGRINGIRSTAPFDASQEQPDDRRQRRLTSQLEVYYETVASALRNADWVLVLGPGEAKVELKKRLERDGLGGRIAEVETADRMTDRQLAAAVRQYYSTHRELAAGARNGAGRQNGLAIA